MRKLVHFILNVIFLMLLVSCVYAHNFRVVFEKANKLYEEGKYEESINEHEKFLSLGLEGANIYYNLGNAYFKVGRKGKAILNYRRALRLAPKDKDAQANLAYLESLIEDKIDISKKTWFEVKLREIFEFITVDGITILAFIFYLALFGCSILALFVRGRRKTFIHASWIVGIVFAVCMIVCIIKIQDIEVKKKAVVISSEIDVRYGPFEQEKAAFKLHEGTLLFISEEREGWYRIRLSDGNGGWLKKNGVEVI